MDKENKVVLQNFPVFHAGRKKILHPTLNREIYSQTAVSYLRFLRKVRIDYLELSVTNNPLLSGRWVPKVPTHPAHIVVSVLDKQENIWKVVKEIELPLNPLFRGDGLSQEMGIKEMEEFFEKAVAQQPPHYIELGGITTDCIKVECDREHPVWPNHGECNGGLFNVPFGILRNLRAYGKVLEEFQFPVYRRKLEKEVFRPSAPKGMKIVKNPLEVLFIGKKLSIGFSLIRPVLTYLSWDYFGEGRNLNNRLFFGSPDSSVGENGPFYLTDNGNFSAQNMTGKISVEDNQVKYYDIDTGVGVKINAVFTVYSESIEIQIEQIAEEDIPLIEGEAWRLVWNMRAGMTGVASLPMEKEGRNGFVVLPALICGDEGGCLLVEIKEGTGMFHTESYREKEKRSTGFVLAEKDTIEKPLIISKGIHRAVFNLRPSVLLPAVEKREKKISRGIKRCWSAGFSAFRPELGGFSNNAISINCHVNQYVAFDFAVFTSKINKNDPVDLAKFSIGRALMDGGGYGYHRNLYMDSDPVLLSGAGRIFQLTKDKKWIEYIAPGIVAAICRIIDNFDKKEGMVICRTLSGNSGSYRWSSNGMDVIGFGHIDAYVNAWSFRAMKNASVLCDILGDSNLAKKCKEIVKSISENYTRHLLNSITGWIAGWKSRDGELHDYGFLWINGIACAFRVVDTSTARSVLSKLEAKRQEIFPESGYQGLPLNLFPIKETDHMLSQMMEYKLKPSFENYTDGALSPCLTGYYIRALSSCGLKKEARKIAFNLEKGFVDGKFHGPYGTGKEFATWTGADSGYEGTFGLNSLPLYAIAVERGIIEPPNPEWWIAD